MLRIVPVRYDIHVHDVSENFKLVYVQLNYYKKQSVTGIINFDQNVRGQD